MEKTSIPLNHPIGIQTCKVPEHGIYQLTVTEQHLNSVGSIRASIIFSLAEESSYAFLFKNTEEFEPDEYIPNLRSADIKFRATTSGPIYSVGKYSERDWKRFQRALIKNNRALVAFPIHVMNESGKCIAVAHFEWFVFRKPKRQRKAEF